MPQPELCVIFNPAAGKSRAGRRIESLRQSWGDRVAFWPTQRPGHAMELAKQASLEGFSIVAGAGGDGTIHEVANGILESGRDDVRFALFPIGSANDFAYSLFRAADNGQKARRIDVGMVRAEDGRSRHFVCCAGLGFSGAVTVESRRIQLLQGVLLYGWATIKALWRRYAVPMAELEIDGEVTRMPTLMFSLFQGEREGGFVLAPNALLDDGLFDFVQIGSLSRLEVMRFLPRLALFGPPTHHPKIRQGRCRTVRFRCDDPVSVHLDGELLCTQEDGLRSFEMELKPGALCVDMEASAPLR
ncbi:MAG: diacylglycerol kinase family lipid kinase [Gemmataceae bacterium]|nr:diacylglycerol kinase family lipid kinase [Gemmataceae bacterium]